MNEEIKAAAISLIAAKMSAVSVEAAIEMERIKICDTDIIRMDKNNRPIFRDEAYRQLKQRLSKSLEDLEKDLPK